MKLLSLSTAEQGCSLAVTDGERLICEDFWDAKQTHSKRLVSMIDHIIDQRTNFELTQIDGFVAAKGPGSFTGLRIGISVIKGLSFAMERPVFGVSSLDGIAYQFVFSSLPVYVMMDARRNQVYWACYRFENGTLVSKSKAKVTRPEDVLKGLSDNKSAIFAGSGSKVYRDLINTRARSPVIADSFFDSVSASAMIRFLLSQGNFPDSEHCSLTPYYIRKSDAEIKYPEK